MNLGSILEFIGGALTSFFPKDVAAQDVGEALEDLGNIVAEGGGTLPAFDVAGAWEVGPIPVKRKAGADVTIDAPAAARVAPATGGTNAPTLTVGDIQDVIATAARSAKTNVVKVTIGATPSDPVLFQTL
jgi:hypothetical protein